MEINKYELSIIIPCYNVEKYLKRCLDKLIDTKFEIIVIDDGSTDSTGTLCDSYSVYENFFIYHKQNGGLSDARNFGLEKATGKYVAFLDSDDYIDVENLQTLLKESKEFKGEIIYCDFIKKTEINELEVHTSVDQGLYNGKDLLSELIVTKCYYPMVWKSIYLRSFLIEKQLYFKKGIYHEDEDWTIRALLLAKRVQVNHISFYYYWSNSDSITHNKKDKHFEDIMNISFPLIQKIKDCDFIITDYLSNLYLSGYVQFSKKKKMELDFKNIHSRDIKIKYILCKYFKKIYKIVYVWNLNRNCKF